ncbi:MULTISPECIES: type I-F CRISPR-associated helicase Cas3f [unclassified Acinetobacter]|uniref:type I-F CRISPR-associated helicase Cas3f n=1 Tax=unclassified Acinetobacter TaxID=196816 RepID=UPI00190AE527|nr:MULTISPECIES: type I-F CRISPR-associated helicase Cas3f [unclassified Acinetobacter]MBK0063613.1 type I-F CRISPR-associated helicase Cas3 [Acinetobacter sp. S55]MBK0067491.1 type I-F CRISPR-associated helicase Cas3 [Acinetobacter sp. S54]
MIVTFISQCEKKAIPRTRRVLDAFAERIGDNTWQTIITEDGLLAVKKLLRKTVTKNTAVSCHWIRGRRRSELMWIVGNRNKFNEQGIVPVNRTARPIKLDYNDTNWHTAPLIAVLSRIAAMFHDFGKINPFFAKKIANAKYNKKPIADPFRHEWISLRLFEAFVKSCDHNDELWIEKLIKISPENDDYVWLEKMIQDSPDQPQHGSLFQGLPELAKLIAWLIVSHHRLPIPNDILSKDKNSDKNYTVSKFGTVLDDLNFKWCYPKKYDADDQNQKKEIQQCWKIKAEHIPFNSHTWCKEINSCAIKLLQLHKAYPTTNLSDPYLSHVSRLVLMLSDHYYSSCEPTAKWHDPKYPCYANTDRLGDLKQPLDDHLIGVSQSARQLMGALTRLNELFNRLPKQKVLERKTSNSYYKWQDKSYQEACSIQKNYPNHGFFGVNLASTGRGKTLANTRIMYGLADPEKGARFNIALGLRTLTLQTGKALRQKLNLDDTDLAIMVGGGAVKEIFEQYSHAGSEQLLQDTENLDPRENLKLAKMMGSESLSGLFEPDLNVDFEDSELDFEGILSHDHLFTKWLKGNHQVKKMLMSPILCCTIDHLIPATESTRGGRQIAPMLRLMSSDLILDEPDDFSPDDYYALTRLVYWSGLLGSRVLLSSATLTPAEINGLYLAYSSGRKFYNLHRTQANQPIIAAWFDENEKSICHQVIPCDGTVTNSEANPVFEKAHRQFTKKRVAYLNELAKVTQRRSLEWVGLPRQIPTTEKWHEIFTQHILDTSLKAHQLNAITDPQTHKQYSVGLVRFANIDPLATVAQQLLKQKIDVDTRIHLCVYHSRFPLLIRANIEKYLDEILDRNNGKQPHDHHLVQGWLQKYPEQKHIILVLASPVCEVGRDHDYDWMIIEPSSMRSIIQASGRARRHRIEPYTQPNVFIMETNIRHFRHPQQTCFSRPGFEAEGFKFHPARHFLRGNDDTKNAGLMDIKHFKQLDSIARLTQSPANYLKQFYEKSGYPRLADLEHDRMHHILLGNGICPDMRSTDVSPIKFPAYSFWNTPIHYTGILQTLSRFRQSQAEFFTALRAENEEQALKLYQYNEKTGNWLLVESLVRRIELVNNPQIHCWPNQKTEMALQKYLDMASVERGWSENCSRYLSLNLPKLADQKKWLYHDWLGFIRE